MDGRVWEALHVSHALARSGRFDLVHNQVDWLPLAFAEHARAPMLTTIHGFSGSGILPAYAGARSAYVAISEADRSDQLEYVATVHHGIDFSELPLNLDPGRTRRLRPGTPTKGPRTPSRSPVPSAAPPHLRIVGRG